MTPETEALLARATSPENGYSFEKKAGKVVRDTVSVNKGDLEQLAALVREQAGEIERLKNLLLEGKSYAGYSERFGTDPTYKLSAATWLTKVRAALAPPAAKEPS